MRTRPLWLLEVFILSARLGQSTTHDGRSARTTRMQRWCDRPYPSAVVRVVHSGRGMTPATMRRLRKSEFGNTRSLFSREPHLPATLASLSAAVAL